MISFVVGGGSYVEQQNLAEWGASAKISTYYGSTDMVSASDFANELHGLAEQGGGGFM